MPREHDVVVVTDPAGSIPLYYGYGSNGGAMGTMVHHVAQCSGLTSVDRVSATDFLLHGAVCHPYAWYEGVRVPPPGTVCTFGPEDMESHVYWTPTEPETVCASCDVQVWADRLRDKVRAAVEASLDGAERTRVLFSGGEDARAVLGLVPDHVSCTPTTVLGHKNREYRLAQWAAWGQGYELDWIERPDGYYRSSVADRINAIGPGWDIRHMHVFGRVAEPLQDADVLLGGYGADTLFKTHYMTNMNERLGRPDRLRPPEPDQIEALNFDWGTKLFRREVVEQVRERRKKHHERLKVHRPKTAGNWHWLWPLRPRAYAQYMTSMRIGPRMAEPFLFNQVYQLAAKMPDPCRVYGRAFRQAFAAEMGLSGWMPTSSNAIPRLGPRAGALYKLGHRALWKLIKEVQGIDEWEAGSWSRDHEGWHPVDPARHFSKRGHKHLSNQLQTLLEEKSPEAFFSDPKVPDAMRVRALGLGFTPVADSI